jgi:LmbE family N-acetylglucosaminyl deacetylase
MTTSCTKLRLWVVLLLLAASPAYNHAAEPVTSRNVELRQTLRKLHTTARLMQTTAHPDDEDGGMLTLESRGKGASVLLLTLDRGEGGQNKMGSNLLDVLGVLRTLELLASGEYYGVEQRFARVVDFGFSKNPEETFEKWHGHDIALSDMVRVIRSFRPDVLVSRFQGNAKDGHGQHSAAGILTREAFRAAADPSRFPEQIKEGLAPWQATKLYVDNVHPPEEYNLALDTGATDPLLESSYVQYAMQGLKHQLSQGAGAWEVPAGQHLSYYRRVDIATPQDQREADFFDGIDTSLPALATRLGKEEDSVPFLRPALVQLAAQIQKASTAAESDPPAAAAPLLAGLQAVNELIGKVDSSQLFPTAKANLLVNLRTKQEQLQEAANLALGLELQATVDAPPANTPGEVFTAVPGQSFKLTVKLSNHGPKIIAVREIALDLPEGWQSRSSDKPVSLLKPGEEAAAQFTVTVPENAALTRPYWHRDHPESDAIYTLDQPQFATLPFPPPPVRAHAVYAVDGGSGRATATGEAAYLDSARQVHEIPLAVAPELSVAVDPAMLIVPLAEPGTFAKDPQVRVIVKKNVATEVHGAVRLQAPSGWTVEPATAVLEMKPAERRTDYVFRLTPRGLQPGRAEIGAVVTSAGKSYSEGYTVVTRPDLPAFNYYQPSRLAISAVDVKVPAGLKIGYIIGAGDEIPPVLQQAGLDVSRISGDDLATGDLHRFDTIVVGIRAYDTREDVRKFNSRLLDYVSAGGTLLVQYNSGLADFNAGHFTPYPATLSRERVTVEEAPVEILTPQDPLFQYPNRITPADFDGWVQERGLYFMNDWDSHFEPLLASHDPGESPLKGGLLRAHYGKGTYIYTGYSFFRQLPAGVPGAIRLFVNLVSAGHEKNPL